jgi:hypothetical protein
MCPVEVYEMVPGDDDEASLSSALRLVGSAPFVGRRAEFARLEACSSPSSQATLCPCSSSESPAWASPEWPPLSVLTRSREVCRRLGQTDRAAKLLTVVTRWAGQILVGGGGLSIDGASDRAMGHLLAALGRFDEADAAYTTAAELEHTAGFPPFVARTKYWHATALIERDEPGDQQRAQQLLDDTIDLTERLHMPLLRRHAEASRHHADRHLGARFNSTGF